MSWRSKGACRRRGEGDEAHHDKAKLARRSACRETVELKVHFLETEQSGEACFTTLKALVSAAGTQVVPPTAAFRAGLARPITALPANRIPVSRAYATR